jgi:UDP-N-acetyl-D-mannosaminuronic acid transferase (WecB/TagA/CpsF family)
LKPVIAIIPSTGNPSPIPQRTAKIIGIYVASKRDVMNARKLCTEYDSAKVICKIIYLNGLNIIKQNIIHIKKNKCIFLSLSENTTIIPKGIPMIVTAKKIHDKISDMIYDWK